MFVLQGLPILAALLIAGLLIVLAVRVIKETVWTGLIVVAILVGLYFGFGITPARILDTLLHLPQYLQALWQAR